MTDKPLSAHFSLAEFVRSSVAVRNGIDNAPTPSAMQNIVRILAPGMQRVRDALGAPVQITSGYRCQDVERALKRKPDGWISTSQHTEGLAADFVAPGFGSPRAVVKHLMQRQPEIRYDQLIFEGTWVHISFAADGQGRGEVLTAHFSPGQPVRYTNGLA